MSCSPRLSSLALLAATLLAVCAAPAAAVESSPATVTVRVEGLTETKLAATTVTTTTEPVVKDSDPEHSCPGTSAAGALEIATHGSWAGTWFGGLGYSVDTILGENHSFEEGFYWSFWLDEKEAATGVCGAALQPGDRVLFFPASTCFGEECPAPSLPLGVEAPASARVGEPVAVVVKRYSFGGESTPLAGAGVSGGGASATTDGAGRATLTFGAAGPVVVVATAPASIRAEATVCVHNGEDGTCGTTAPPGSSGVAGQSSHTPIAFVAQLHGILGEHTYARHHAPRLLSGTVTSPEPVTSVSLRLRRTYRGRCFAYDGAREVLARVRCRVGSYFRVASSAGAFSYQLPFALPPGRYVLDVDATDSAGKHTYLVRGVSRFVFHVRR
jgi:hypothetical protein